MSYDNYLNIKPSEVDGHIYRVMPVRRLLQAFEEQKIVLVPPRKWDDPFENLLLSSKVILSETGESGSMPDIRDKVYGQCWTLHRETDAMWRIYSADTNGVKVRTKVRRLLSALKSSDQRFSDVTCFIGKVEYLTQSDLVSTLKGLDLFNVNGSGVAKSLLYKRKEFSHEKEMRLIYTQGEGMVHLFDADPVELFDEIVFDPRMDPYLYSAYESAVRNYGFKGRVAQSVLYQPPEGLIINM